MIAPLFKKNTSEQTQFSLGSGGIQYCGKVHALADVLEVRSYRVIHQTRHIPVGVTVAHDPAMSFAITMRGGERLIVTEQSTWLYSSKSEEVNNLQTAYNEICQKTFEQRARRYTSTVESSGLFEYAGWRFFPLEGRISQTGKPESYVVGEMSFLRHYGYIELVRKTEGIAGKFLRKAKRELGGGALAIDTLTDTDVFFPLLNHYFQLRW